ncbi:MAG TPA: hypothetical protein PKI90_09550, partial [bacterium]|nr:hypothetical protein [bacterium]
MKSRTLLAVCALSAALVLACAPKLAVRKPAYDYSKMDKESARVHKKVEALIDECVAGKQPLPLTRGVRIHSLILDPGRKTLAVTFNRNFSYPPFRPENVRATYKRLREL